MTRALVRLGKGSLLVVTMLVFLTSPFWAYLTLRTIRNGLMLTGLSADEAGLAVIGAVMLALFAYLAWALGADDY